MSIIQPISSLLGDGVRVLTRHDEKDHKMPAMSAQIA